MNTPIAPQPIANLSGLVSLLNSRLPEGMDVRVGLDPVPGDRSIFSLVCEGFTVGDHGDFVSSRVLLDPDAVLSIEVSMDYVTISDVYLSGYALEETVEANVDIEEEILMHTLSLTNSKVSFSRVTSVEDVHVEVEVEFSIEAEVTIADLCMDESYTSIEEATEAAEQAAITHFASEFGASERGVTVEGIVGLTEAVI